MGHDDIEAEAHPDLWAALAESLARLSERALLHGVMQGYRSVDEPSPDRPRTDSHRQSTCAPTRPGDPSRGQLRRLHRRHRGEPHPPDGAAADARSAAKYKATSAARYTSADQMLAYCTALNVPAAWLVYAAGDGLGEPRCITNTQVTVVEYPLDVERIQASCSPRSTRSRTVRGRRSVWISRGWSSNSARTLRCLITGWNHGAPVDFRCPLRLG